MQRACIERGSDK